MQCNSGAFFLQQQAGVSLDDLCERLADCVRDRLTTRMGTHPPMRITPFHAVQSGRRPDPRCKKRVQLCQRTATDQGDSPVAGCCGVLQQLEQGLIRVHCVRRRSEL